MKRDVLDKGFVRLVDHMGSDLNIVRAARVSYDADWRAGLNEGSDARLIRYLLENKHSTPFEAVTFTFEVKAPIFVLRQWHRHRTWAYNEVSARYTTLDEGWYVPDGAVIGRQSVDNKQSRDILSPSDADHNAVWENNVRGIIMDACERANADYRALILNGCPRELARSVLPVANYSRMFATVNLHNLLHFLRLRLHKHAQYEIRQYALALFDLASQVAPVTMSVFNDTQRAT